MNAGRFLAKQSQFLKTSRRAICETKPIWLAWVELGGGFLEITKRSQFAGPF
jgi:hypothetical protein